MPDLPLSVLSDDRLDYGIPVAKLVNMYVEAVPQGETRSIRAPRPGMGIVLQVGSGPIRGMAYQDDVGLYIASGEHVYQIQNDYSQTDIGTVSGVDPVRMALTTGAIGFVTDGSYWLFTGTTLQKIITFKANDDGSTGDPLPSFSDISYLGDRFILSVVNSTQFYFTDLDDFGSIDPLSFEQADTTADRIVGIGRLGDDMAFFKSQTTEWWSLTSDTNAPYTRSQGRNYQRGCIAKNSTLVVDNALFFVGDDRIVYRTGLIPQRISIHGVEERLKASVLDPDNDWTAFRYDLNGHKFYALCVPDQGTFVYDASTQQWAEWASYGQTAFVGGYATERNNMTLIGSAISNFVYAPTVARNDDNGYPIERRVSAFIPPQSQDFRLNNVALKTVSGFGLPSVTFNAVVEYRDSEDGGRTFSDWDARQLGFEGDTTLRPVWRRLGVVGSFGRYVEWRCTDDVRFVVEGASYNDARPD